MNPTICLNIRFENKIKKFPYRYKYTNLEFLALIANSFNIKQSEKLLILKDSHGNKFDLASWLNKPREDPSKVLDLSYENINHSRSLKKNLNISQNPNKSPSKLIKDISKLQLPIGLIQNLQEFEKKFLKSTKTQYITLIFFFDDFDSAYSSLLKHISSLISNNEAVDFFYCVAEEKDNSIYNEKFTLKRPFFVVFHGANKFLEMRLNLSEIDFEEIMIKIQKETESSLDDPNYQSENDEFNNNEINSNRDDSETKSVFLVFLKKMMDSEIISDLEFYYLKCLFLENSMDFPQIIFSHLENRNYENFKNEIIKYLQKKNNIDDSRDKIFNIEKEEDTEPEVYFLKDSENRESPIDIEEFNTKREAINVVRKRNFKENDQKILLKLIQDDDEIILSCLEKFKQVRDEKDLLISFQKILRNLRVNLKQNNFFIEKEQANNESINRVKLQEQVIEQNNIVKHQPLMQTNTEKPKSNIFLMKDKKNEGNPPAKIEKINQVQVPINQKRENSTSIVGSNEEKIGSFSNFNIITFLEKNEEKFSNEQYGLIMNLSKNNDEEFKAMIYQCQNIKNQELVLKLLISLAETKMVQFLIKTFESKEIQYIEKFKMSKNSLIFQAFADFKNTQNFEELRSSLLSICVSQGLRKNAPIDDKIIGRQLITQSSKPRSISRPEQQEKPSINNLPKLDDTKKKTNYASMALERKVQRTNSQKEIKFEMILRKGSTNEEIEINNRQNNKTDPFKISVGQREMNSGFEKLINDFYQQENQNHFDEIYHEMISQCNFLDAVSKKRLDLLFNHNDFGLLAILSRFQKNKSVAKIKKGILNLLVKEIVHYEMDDGSPLMRAKIQKHNTMKHIMNELYGKHLITQKQIKLFNYLYLAEDISILSSFEVFMNTDDQTDFVENLLLINKHVFFQTRLDFDEIEQFDENIENQLSLLYAFKKYLNHSQRVTLEKLIRAGDDFLTKSSRENQEKFNKQEFIQKIKEYATQKDKDLIHVEKILKEQHQKTRENHSEKYKEMLSNFASQKFLKGVNIEFLKKLVDVNHVIIEPIFTVFDMTKDKEDFLENIKLAYKVVYKESFMNIITKYWEKFKWTEEKKKKLKNSFEAEDKILVGAYEVFLMFFDEESEEEFADTANRFLKIK